MFQQTMENSTCGQHAQLHASERTFQIQVRQYQMSVAGIFYILALGYTILYDDRPEALSFLDNQATVVVDQD